MEENKQNCCAKPKNNSTGFGGGIYGLAFIGSLVYYIQHSNGFISVVLGILKAIIWPATIAYKLLEFFKM